MAQSRLSSMPAPELHVTEWLNTPQPITLRDLRGKVVVIHAFQMLCPGCVSHGIPQAERIRRTFRDDVAVIGLHSVFEHHAVMTVDALKVFLHEYRVSIPIGVDQPTPGQAVPMTMQAYGMRGTPSLIVLDKAGNIRLHHFGQADDMAVGALIGQLVGETPPSDAPAEQAPMANGERPATGCDTGTCAREAS
ncbi:Peroxiredoxin [Cupriavidus sp. YR651]|uniref:redoxin family protein n=1 Tax=Cupriavidus sp. YR651 TaxID=1855315 RepID=UPI00087F1E76|nr:redoxin family protein [Cupriavidus sp. YR651]SDC98629.1 Peroxiredoxin [Cupriavidus sp. YR651]